MHVPAVGTRSRTLNTDPRIDQGRANTSRTRDRSLTRCSQTAWPTLRARIVNPRTAAAEPSPGSGPSTANAPPFEETLVPNVTPFASRSSMLAPATPTPRSATTTPVAEDRRAREGAGAEGHGRDRHTPRKLARVVLNARNAAEEQVEAPDEPERYDEQHGKAGHRISFEFMRGGLCGSGHVLLPQVI